MEYLPVTLNIKGNTCLIVGGGDVAARKLKTLLKAGAKVELVSLSISDDVEKIIAKHGVGTTQIKKMDIGNSLEFESLLLNQLPNTSNFHSKTSVLKVPVSKVLVPKYSLIIAATDQPMTNRMVSVTAKKLNIPVNVVDNLQLSSFILPAIIDRSPLLVAVSTAGVSPLLARKIRERIEWVLPKNLGSIFASLMKIRETLKQKNLSFRNKKDYLEQYIDSRLNDEKLNDENLHLIGEPSKESRQSLYSVNSKGKVYLVGAGPGDPDLLTIKALKLLQKADVVFYDSLVSEEILELIRRDAKLVHVGKRAKCHSASQDKINELLIESVNQHSTVIRLKGGDPFIFGRGGEELESLAKLSIQFEVVPGITAASGCASYAGIPLTHRDYSQSLHFVTAHEKTEKSSIDWQSLAKKNQTLVFYMGLLKNKTLSEQLITNGLSSSTPVAVIENGTRVDQRVFTGSIEKLTSVVEKNSIKSPAIIIVGEVVTLHESLSWFNQSESYWDNQKQQFKLGNG
ncbi:MAG: uroporphyrin-III C-methyltransferase/precorrin-2 dehydrogenase/sirohydrochlorin ferrochelatase [Polaribacter sp.]|jgi:uroporphyrin-III C-methyltransferase/precorrin-2 dehydrogenase/sirohydrochlorin ferrochelatase